MIVVGRIDGEPTIQPWNTFSNCVFQPVDLFLAYGRKRVEVIMVKKRDPKVVERFLKKEGLTKIPKGKEVDHKRPFVNGGSDTVRNLQLLTVKQHAAKTKREAQARAKKKK